MTKTELDVGDVSASAGTDDMHADIQDDVTEDIDRQAGYDHETASKIQTLIAESAAEIADEATDKTDQISGINQRMDDLVADLQMNN